MNKTIVAICYDFDSTLSTHEMQYWLTPKLNMSIKDFWANQDKMTGVDFVLSYMWITLNECKKKGVKVTRDFLQSCGKDVQFYNGVKSWFKRLNEYALSKNIILEHYIISTGSKEIIEGTPIFKEFRKIYACEYLYNEKGEAFWPKFVVNGTAKTQYLFRINKGIENDDFMEVKVNKRVEKKRVEFRNMIYIGDGITDIPCMTLVKEKGGTAIAVYSDDKKNVGESLIQDRRVNFACRADYSSGSELDKMVKLVLDSIQIKEKLNKKENKN